MYVLSPGNAPCRTRTTSSLELFLSLFLSLSTLYMLFDTLFLYFSSSPVFSFLFCNSFAKLFLTIVNEMPWLRTLYQTIRGLISRLKDIFAQNPLCFHSLVFTSVTLYCYRCVFLLSLAVGILFILMP